MIPRRELAIWLLLTLAAAFAGIGGSTLYLILKPDPHAASCEAQGGHWGRRLVWTRGRPVLMNRCTFG